MENDRILRVKEMLEGGYYASAWALFEDVDLAEVDYKVLEEVYNFCRSKKDSYEAYPRTRQKILGIALATGKTLLKIDKCVVSFYDVKSEVDFMRDQQKTLNNCLKYNNAA